MKRKAYAGTTSLTLPLYAQDSSTGAGLSGLTSATGGLVAEYRRQGQSSWTAITLASGTLGTWSSGGLVADGSLAGAYELGVPNAAVAAGAPWVAVRLHGATGMIPVLCEVELDALNYQDGVRLGMTALPNAAAGASGGLPLGNSSGNVGADLQTVKTQAVTASAPVAVLASVGTAATSAAQTGDAYARLGTPAGVSIAADVATRAASTQIPASFNSATFASAGVFSTAALANAPASGGGGGGGVVTGYADGQAPDELVWAAAERTLTNVSGVTLSGGTVSASPSPTATTFRATGLPAGLVTGDLNGMSLIFQGSESNTTRTGMRRTIATTGGHTVSGSTHIFVLTLALGAPPAAGDTFDIG